MKKATLCYCLTNDQILLGMKKRGFGEGKWNGYGGKVLENETPKRSTVRELAEESGLIVEEKDLEQVAILRFYFDKKPIFECYVFFTRTWRGELVETEEMKPQWYPLSNIPYEIMWADDPEWLPLVLAGERIEGEINFNEDGSVVKEFTYKPATFL